MTVKIERAVVFTCALAVAFAALAEPYAFAVGEKIPLGGKDGDATTNAVYVTKHKDCKIDKSYCVVDDVCYGVSDTKKGRYFEVSLVNGTESSNYVLSWKGGSKFPATYVVSVSDGVSYLRSVTVSQRNTGDWSPTQPAYLMLDSLPTGNLTLRLDISEDDGNGNYTGNYGNFMISSPESVALAIPSETIDIGAGYVSLANCRYDNGNIGYTEGKATIGFTVYCGQRAKYGFSYKFGTQAVSANMNWTLSDTSGTQMFSCVDAIYSTSGWTPSVLLSHDFGILPAGFYVLSASFSDADTSTSSGYVGNFGNFAFSMTPFYTVTVPEVAHATVSIATNNVVIGTSAGEYEVEGGSAVVVTYTADDPEMALSPTGTFTFDPIGANETVSAPTVIVPPSTVTVPAVEHASASVTTNGVAVAGVNGVYTVEKGATVVVTYTPDEGYGLSGQTSWTFENVSGSNAINANDAPSAEVALAISEETADTPIPADAREAYASCTGCSVDNNNGTIHSTRDGHTFSFKFYCPERAWYGFSFQSGQKEGWGAATLSWTLGADNVGSTEIGGEGYTYNGNASLTVSHSLDLGILDQGIYMLTCTFSKDDGNYCGNYGNFAFSRKDGVPYAIANGESRTYVGQHLENSETLENSDYGIFVEAGGKIVVDLKTMGLPACDGTRSGDGTLELPAITFGEGADIVNSVSVTKPAGFKPVYFVMYDGHGVITLDRASGGLIIAFF